MDQLTQRATVETIVRVYTEAEQNITKACAAIAGSLKTMNTTLGTLGLTRDIEFGRERGVVMNYADPKDQIHELRRQLWSALVERLEIRRMLSTARAQELDEWLDKTTEEITFESVTGLFRNYVEQLPDMLTEAVSEVYDMVRPRMSKLKTNTQYELGSKVILHHWVEPGVLGGLKANYHYRAEYTALENVFSALDGRGSIAKSYQGELSDAISAATAAENFRGETRYFRFRACLNGNLHLEFTRPDLVQKFNELAGGRRLKHDVDARSQRDAPGAGVTAPHDNEVRTASPRLLASPRRAAGTRVSIVAGERDAQGA